MEHRNELKPGQTRAKRRERAVDKAPEQQDQDLQAALKEMEDLAARQDELLDEGVEETFPASDPVSVKRIT